MTATFEMIQESMKFIQVNRLQTGVRYNSGIGLGRLADYKADCVIPYEQIPHFLSPQLKLMQEADFWSSPAKGDGHAGRFHYYEGYSMQQIVFPIRVMKFLSVKT